jgi:hypothetical protein
MKKGKKKEQKSKAKQRDLERLILSVREKEKEPKKRVLESGIGNKKPRFLSLSLFLFFGSWLRPFPKFYFQFQTKSSTERFSQLKSNFAKDISEAQKLFKIVSLKNY